MGLLRLSRVEIEVDENQQGPPAEGKRPALADICRCRVKVNGKYGKKYNWSMVNELARVVVYFYDDGRRGRDVLREFLGNTEIDALQSDGFNVYMYMYLKDGRYNIDRSAMPLGSSKNSLAERSLRPIF